VQGIGLVRRVLKDRGVRDANGMKVDRRARIGTAAVLVTPAHEYPSGAVLAAERRAELLDWAERSHWCIIEDDCDAEYRYDRTPLDPRLPGGGGHVISDLYDVVPEKSGQVDNPVTGSADYGRWHQYFNGVDVTLNVRPGSRFAFMGGTSKEPLRQRAQRHGESGGARHDVW